MCFYLFYIYYFIILFFRNLQKDMQCAARELSKNDNLPIFELTGKKVNFCMLILYFDQKSKSKSKIFFDKLEFWIFFTKFSIFFSQIDIWINFHFHVYDYYYYHHYCIFFDITIFFTFTDIIGKTKFFVFIISDS